MNNSRPAAAEALQSLGVYGVRLHHDRVSEVFNAIVKQGLQCRHIGNYSDLYRVLWFGGLQGAGF